MTENTSSGAVPSPPSPPRAERRPVEMSAHGVRLDRRLCLDPGGELARGAARPGNAAGRNPRLSRRRTPTPTRFSAPTRALQRQLVARDAGAAEGGRQQASADGRAVRLLFALPPRAASTASSAAGRAAAATRRSSSTATRAPSATRSFSLAARAPFARSAKLAWSADDKGSEMYAIRVRDLARRHATSTTASRTRRPDIVWTRDSGGFLYIAQDENHRPLRVMLHRLGDGAGRRRRGVRGGRSRRGSSRLGADALGLTAIISLHGHDASEAHLVDLADPAAPPRLDRAAPGGACATT